MQGERLDYARPHRIKTQVLWKAEEGRRVDHPSKSCGNVRVLTQVSGQDHAAHAVREQEERQVWIGLGQQGAHLRVHGVDFEASDSLATAEAETFEVYQVHDEAI